MRTRVSARELRAMFEDGEELALIDAREEGAYALSHILYASNVPVGCIELRAPALLPRRGVRVVCCDAGEGLAERAAERLLEHGYSQVQVLQGGIGGWAEDGGELFSGVNVPSKGFGECVELRRATPSITPQALAARLQAGEPTLVLDSRPFEEYAAHCIPGGVCAPGVELVHRVQELLADEATPVVINCAGRTRSIIGAQSLIDAGLPNPVFALRDGTMGWHLAGGTLETGAARRAREPSAEGLALARERAAAVRSRHGVPAVDAARLEAFQREADGRSLYLFDVRQPEEYEAGHIPDSLCAPGGQLVQETDRHAAVLGARLVLVDDTGVRASTTAAWLRQMGWDAHVLEGGVAGFDLETGPQVDAVLGLEQAEAVTRTPEQVSAMLRQQRARVLDLSSSPAYAQAHVPGAGWGLRSRLHAALGRLPAGGCVVLVSEDDRLARLAAAEAASMDVRPVVVMEGGMRAWRAARLPLESGFTHPADQPDDVCPRPWDGGWGDADAMRDYLDWERGLVEQLRRDGTARFELPAGHGARS